MPLSESEIRQVQIHLNLSVQQLLPNSGLRLCIKTAEDNDTRYGLAVISDVQNNLSAIADLETKIENIKTSNADSIKRKNIDDEVDIEYKAGADAAQGLKEQRSKLISRIANDLNIYRKQHSGRKLRS